MTWVRIHDGAPHHRKILALSDSAHRLWINGLCYCQEQLTDGFIPDAVVWRLHPKAKKLAADLVTLVLWHREEGGYRVHDYLDWNDAKDAIIRKRQDRKDRIEKWREKNASRNASRNALQNEAGDAFGTTTVTPDPRTTTTTTTTRKDLKSAPRARGKGHHGHTFCGERFCVPSWLHEEFIGWLGQLADAFDLLAQYPAWDQQLAASGEAKEPIPWLKERVRLEAGLERRTFADRRIEAELRARAVQARKAFGRCPHDPRCGSVDECVAEFMAEARAKQEQPA